MRLPLTCGLDDPARDFVEIANAAFYDGYMLALCKSKEEYDRLSSMDRIILMCYAKVKADKILDDFQP